MSARIPLPHHASLALDEAVMTLADAQRMIEPVRKGKQMILAESQYRASETTLLIEQAISCLKQIRIDAKQPPTPGAPPR